MTLQHNLSTHRRTTGTGEQPVLRQRRPGFTLIEVLVVVIILGVLATIVVKSFAVSVDDAARTRFASNLKSFVNAAELYRFETGEFLEDSNSGTLPSGFDDYIDPGSWVGGTPIGGVWDSEMNSSGITSGIGVHFNGTGTTRDDDYMIEIDAMIDDGDLSSGGFRKIASDRYYWVIAD
ncbi:MAG: prepilin-type N-terminal cleavage/methylation domain-containing protein [Phycisphaerales bacterium]|nr:MAG: prepilin-type N-terminal cleavage/methylation domain-containing protein [Phycisphaerales bacterium]